MTTIKPTFTTEEEQAMIRRIDAIVGPAEWSAKRSKERRSKRRKAGFRNGTGAK